MASERSQVVVGSSVCKRFDGQPYWGTIEDSWQDDESHTWYHIVYEDGDREDLAYDEVLSCLVAKRQKAKTRPTAATAATCSKAVTHTQAGKHPKTASCPGAAAMSIHHVQESSPSMEQRLEATVQQLQTQGPSQPKRRGMPPRSSYLANHLNAVSALQEVEQVACSKCGRLDNEDVLMLCDNPQCSAAWHTFCLQAPLPGVPEGDWHCPGCAAARQGAGGVGAAGGSGAVAEAKQGTGGLSAYEVERQQQIERNRQRLLALQLPDLLSRMERAKPSKRPRTSHSPKPPAERTRESSRLKSQEAMQQGPLPPNASWFQSKDGDTASDAAFLQSLQSATNAIDVEEVPVSMLYRSACQYAGLQLNDVAELSLSWGASAITFHPSATHPILAGANKNGTVALWRLARDARTHDTGDDDKHTSSGMVVASAHARRIIAMHWLVKGGTATELFTASLDDGMKVLDVQAGIFKQVQRRKDRQPVHITCADVTDDGQLVYIGSRNGGLSLLDLRDGNLVFLNKPATRMPKQKRPRGSPGLGATSPSPLVGGAEENTPPPDKQLHTVCVEPGVRRLIATAEQDGIVRVRDRRYLALADKRAIPLANHTCLGTAASWAPDGSHRLLVTVPDFDRIQVWHDPTITSCCQAATLVRRQDVGLGGSSAHSGFEFEHCGHMGYYGAGGMRRPPPAVWSASGDAVLVGVRDMAGGYGDDHVSVRCAGADGRYSEAFYLNTRNLPTSTNRTGPKHLAVHPVLPMVAAASASTFGVFR